MAAARFQISNRILMVRPVHFTFNEQTAGDNEFQHRPADAEEINRKALAEFDQAVSTLRSEGVEVLVLEPNDALPTPDEVFPNNWFATFGNGSVALFPMYAPNRQAEKLRYPQVEKMLLEDGLLVNQVQHIGPWYRHQPACEGTGSLVIDHVNRVVYAALSIRTDAGLVAAFAQSLGYPHVVTFHTQSRAGKEFYHTNVVMAILEGVAVVCSEAVPDAQERQTLMASLSQHHEVVDISLAQAEESFCANVLGVKGNSGQTVVMSSSAYEGFTETQLQALNKYGKLLPISIPTIEFVGGGSARCMIAEVFLPKAL